LIRETAARILAQPATLVTILPEPGLDADEER